MAGRQAPSGRTRSYKTTTASTRASSSTRRFATVSTSSSSRARLAREKQRRQYEQQKREKLIFAMFVVVILVMILFAILIFKKIVGDAPSDTTEDVGVHQTEPPDTDLTPANTFKDEMVARDRIYQGSLILVDSTTPRKITPALTDLSSISGKAYQMSGLGTHMETAAADAFVKLTADLYAATEIKVLVHRCYEEDATDDLGSGLAVDLAVYDGDNTYALTDAACASVLSWLQGHAHEYGFLLLSSEQTGRRHGGLRYVGAPHASYIKDGELTLSDYLGQIRAHSEKDPASIVVDGTHYAIYYVAATGGDMTSVPILADAVSYTVSGDNAGGFIVTAKMD